MRLPIVTVPSVFVLLFFAQPGITPGRENSGPTVRLEFTAVPERQVYHVGEVVRLLCALHNSGDQDVLVARHFVLDEYVWAVVFGPEHKQLPWCGKTDGRADLPDEFGVLRPGATIRGRVRLSCDEHRDSGFVLDRAGTYTVSAYYYLPLPIKSLQQIAGHAAVTKERIRAKKISITLTLPDGAKY